MLNLKQKKKKTETPNPVNLFPSVERNLDGRTDFHRSAQRN
jgi:hypothetical protein